MVKDGDRERLRLESSDGRRRPGTAAGNAGEIWREEVEAERRSGTRDALRRSGGKSSSVKWWGKDWCCWIWTWPSSDAPSSGKASKLGADVGVDGVGTVIVNGK